MRTQAFDDYIAKAAPFAQPILNHFRELVHNTCPEAKEEIKWRMPFFSYKGAPMCHMAAFKHHCIIGFWKAALMKDKALLEMAASETAMGHLGRLTSLKDLPADNKLAGYLEEAMQLNEADVKVLPLKAAAKKELEVPEALTGALAKNKKAADTFKAFSYTNKKEYTDWINEARTEATRDKRITTAVEQMAEGKGRNWKYEKR